MLLKKPLRNLLGGEGAACFPTMSPSHEHIPRRKTTTTKTKQNKKKKKEIEGDTCIDWGSFRRPINDVFLPCLCLEPVKKQIGDRQLEMKILAL